MYNKKDFFHKLAKKEGYLARSAYKLKELNKRFRLLRAGAKVLDLGAAPGAWTQVALEILGKSGAVVAVDLEPLEFTDPQVEAIEADIFNCDLSSRGPFDLVLSDMAPKTSGVRVRDQARSMELAEQARVLAESLLAKGGHLVIKVFEGPELKSLVDALKPSYQKVERVRPDSTRQSSIEIYILGLGKK